MKILITGISGFIGTFLTKQLLFNKHEIIGIDKKEMTSEYKESVTFHKGNILDKDFLTKVMSDSHISSISKDFFSKDAKIDLIIHLAAEHQDFGISEDIFFEVNSRGTEVILECAEEMTIKKFIFYSSVAVYGYQDEATTEKSSTNTTENYGLSKLRAEKSVNDWYERDKDNRSAVIIRPTVVYGPNMNDYANIYRLINSINRKRFMFVGKCENIKSIAYVENIALATEFLMNKIESGYHIFNYSNCTHYQAKEIALIISNSLGKTIPKFILPYNLTLFLGKVFDIFSKLTKINLPITADRVEKFNKLTYHKAEKILEYGFKPKYSNEEGIQRACEWFLKDSGYN